MDMYKETCLNPKEVDLDSLLTYNPKWLKLYTHELHSKAIDAMGFSLYYMQYFHPDMYKDYYSPEGKANSQYSRVDKMCKWYMENRTRLWEHNKENHLEMMKFLFKFEDEVENQC